MDEKPRLGDAELEIMEILWDLPQGGTAAEVLKKLSRPWALATLMTCLSRLADKGFVCCDRTGRNNRYSAAVSRAQYRAGASRAFLEKVFGNSFSGLVTSLYDSKAIGRQDLAELRRFLDELERGQKP